MHTPLLHLSIRGALGRLAMVAIALLALRSELAFAEAEQPSPWLLTTRETTLWSGPDERARPFVSVEKGTLVQRLETRGQRTFVAYPGDGKSRKAGEVWIDNADLEPTAWPRWLRARPGARLMIAGESGVVVLPAGAWLEATSGAGSTARAFYLGDGRGIGPTEGVVEASQVFLPGVPQERIVDAVLTRDLLASQKPEVWLQVPYRSQLDGSEYAGANCGPTSVAMLLEAFGLTHPSGMLRADVLDRQGMAGCDECGVFIQHLAAVAESRGVKTLGLEDDAGELRRWTVDDVREQLRAGHVVIAQVKYRKLPGREGSLYWGDHYVVLTGTLGDRLIYNDPLDSDGSGYGRIIEAARLADAMSSASGEFANAAFAAAR